MKKAILNAYITHEMYFAYLAVLVHMCIKLCTHVYFNLPMTIACLRPTTNCSGSFLFFLAHRGIV